MGIATKLVSGGFAGLSSALGFKIGVLAAEFGVDEDIGSSLFLFASINGWIDLIGEVGLLLIVAGGIAGLVSVLRKKKS